LSALSYYTLGNTGLRVSRLALGTMTFGTDWGWGADEAASRAIFDHYVAAGGNFFDTANLYTNGVSEEMLGKFVRDAGIRDRAVISTKFTYSMDPGNPNAGGNGRKNILRSVENSLKRLGTDYIDLYLLHTWDRITPVEEVMRTYDDLVRSGKVRHVGLSDVPAWYASRAQSIAQFRGLEPLATLELEYSLIERNIEFEFTDLATSQGMGLMVWSPLSGGLLSGKYRRGENGGSGRLITTADSANPAFSKFTPRNWAIIEEVEKVATQLGRTMAQVALNWVANRPAVASVILGATKVAQLEDNLGALDFTIPSELAAVLDAVSRPEPRFPYTFFGPEFQGMVNGGCNVGDKPDGYQALVRSSGAGAGVS
jgi:aryl-alcohol dehydrogenase-like predicted oxidoreductase